MQKQSAVVVVFGDLRCVKLLMSASEVPVVGCL